MQADPASPVAISNALGEYTLAIEPSGSVVVAAAVPYVHGSASNWITNTFETANGVNNADILLPPLGPHAPLGYQPPTAQFCGSCHVDQRTQWAESRHANSANNPWMRDMFDGAGTGVGAGSTGSAGYVFTQTHPAAATGFCATCHAPLEDVFTPGMLKISEVSSPAGADGVSCQACHQIADVNPAQINALGHIGKTSYYFPFSEDTGSIMHVFGPLPDVANEYMANVYSPLFKQSLLCASCHQYNNPNNGVTGQSTFAEWTASPYAVPGPNFRTCQDCHMPPAAGPGTLAILGNVVRPADQRRNHKIVGSTKQTLSNAILMRSSAQIVGNELVVTTEVENRGAGHSFPAGFSIRNAMLVVEASVGGVPLVQTAGPTVPDWANDDVPGIQPGDLGGKPGTGFVKLLRGRINGEGAPVQPVIFLDAEEVVENTTLASGQTRSVEIRFAIPPGTLPEQARFDARLIWRRAFRALAVTKGWTVAPNGDPIEHQVQRVQATAATLFSNGFE